MRLNRTSELKVMTISISRELPLFNFERHDLLCARIGRPCETLWPLNFSRASIFQFQGSRYVMRLNRTSKWNVMTIWISRELPLFNFERLDILCHRAGHTCEKLGPSEFLESIRCLILSVLIYDAPESDIRVKSYDHLNFSRASAVQFQASWYIMRPNRTSVWNVMTIWISRELPSFNFERHDILCARIGRPCETLWPLNFSRASIFQFQASRYVMRLNWTSEWNVMTIWISRELPLLHFELLDILCHRAGHTCEKLWPFEFLESFRCLILSVSIYCAPESNIWVKTYDHLNFSRASVVQFRASLYVMRLN